VKQSNIIVDLTFDFGVQIIQLSRILTDNREYILSRQLLRSATSIGANVEEAIAAQSRRDFISKMSIASKEARETRYWLRLLNVSQIVKLDFNSYLAKAETIVRILTRIVKTSQSKQPG
jgi:four helix bundle protein